MKATRQSLGARVTHVKTGPKILEVGREEVPLACFASRVQVTANLNLCEQVLPFQVQKRKILPFVTRWTISSHVADPSQAFYSIHPEPGFKK
jgi:hypothetical protein